MYVVKNDEKTAEYIREHDEKVYTIMFLFVFLPCCQ